jgi:hypothetical protein
VGNRVPFQSDLWSISVLCERELEIDFALPNAAESSLSGSGWLIGKNFSTAELD